MRAEACSGWLGGFQVDAAWEELMYLWYLCAATGRETDACYPIGSADVGTGVVCVGEGWRSG